MAAAAGAARTALEALAVAEGDPLRSFATTLSCAVVAEGWLAVAHNGDGAVVVVDRDGPRTAARPARGEYANEVAFLTADDGLDHVAYPVEAGGVEAVALLTDGLLRLALQLPAGTTHEPFFAPLLAFAGEAPDPEVAAAELAAFLASDRVVARTDDDTTLVLAVRAAAARADAGPLDPDGD